MRSFGLNFCAGALVLFSWSPVRAQQQSALDQIGAIASGSQCAAKIWNDRGRAPKAYIHGMAVVFARAVCRSDRADVKVVSSARGAPGSDADKIDALTWYDRKFTELGMPNTSGGVDTLRHAYTLLLGLGMRESSGQYCAGRDKSAGFSEANSAEAGLFQTSWGASKAHETLPRLYERYKTDQKACLLDVFSRNVSCKLWDAKTWGKETDEGYNWQKLTKACPAFATEYGAVVLRTHGGRGPVGEFGPIRARAAQVLPECDSMFLQVQKLVQSTLQFCAAVQ